MARDGQSPLDNHWRRQHTQTHADTMSAPLCVGCTVTLQGLKSKPELNGTSGTVSAKANLMHVCGPLLRVSFPPRAEMLL